MQGSAYWLPAVTYTADKDALSAELIIPMENLRAFITRHTVTISHSTHQHHNDQKVQTFDWNRLVKAIGARDGERTPTRGPTTEMLIPGRHYGG